MKLVDNAKSIICYKLFTDKRIDEISRIVMFQIYFKVK